MEIFDIVNEQGEVIGQALREQCHGNPALLHQTVHVLVVDRDENIWLQKRAVTKDIQPGKWDTSVGGHIHTGESVLSAAIRETQEEIGISVPRESFTFCYRYIMRNKIESELVTTFYFRFDDRYVISYDTTEISDGRFFNPHEINQNLGKDIFTPNFEEEWNRYLEWKKESPSTV